MSFWRLADWAEARAAVGAVAVADADHLGRCGPDPADALSALPSLTSLDLELLAAAAGALRLLVTDQLRNGVLVSLAGVGVGQVGEMKVAVPKARDMATSQSMKANAW